MHALRVRVTPTNVHSCTCVQTSQQSTKCAGRVSGSRMLASASSKHTCMYHVHDHLGCMRSKLTAAEHCTYVPNEPLSRPMHVIQGAIPLRMLQTFCCSTYMRLDAFASCWVTITRYLDIPERSQICSGSAEFIWAPAGPRVATCCSMAA